MKKIVLGALVVGALVWAGFALPDSNEEWLRDTLQNSFTEFQGVTAKNVPVEAEREQKRAQILAEKRRVTVENTWPLMECRTAFVMHNAGTVYRRDEMQVVCHWRWYGFDD